MVHSTILASVTRRVIFSINAVDPGPSLSMRNSKLNEQRHSNHTCTILAHHSMMVLPRTDDSLKQLILFFSVLCISYVRIRTGNSSAGTDALDRIYSYLLTLIFILKSEFTRAVMWWQSTSLLWMKYTPKHR